MSTTTSSQSSLRHARSPIWSGVLAIGRCAATTMVLLARRRIRQPQLNRGREISFADGGRAAVYRETVINGPVPSEPAVLVVGFRLRGVRSEWAHRLFRWESELNTMLFAGFPGLVSKLWLRHDKNGLYRGVYQWDGAGRAAAYARSLWWLLALVSDVRSIQWVVLPGLNRDAFLSYPELSGDFIGASDGWWRPIPAAVTFDPGGTA